MPTESLLVAALSLVGMQLPILIAVAVSIVWVIGMARGPVRNGALGGLLLLGAGRLLGMLLSLVPIWLIRVNSYASVSEMSTLLGAGHIALNLMEAFGVVLVVWALTRAVRGTPPPLA